MLGTNDDDEPKPRLTYYNCRDGNCTEIYDLNCNRTCDEKQFNVGQAQIILLQVQHYSTTAVVARVKD